MSKVYFRGYSPKEIACRTLAYFEANLPIQKGYPAPKQQLRGYQTIGILATRSSEADIQGRYVPRLSGDEDRRKIWTQLVDPLV